MRKTKWDNFSKEELKTILENSNTFSEVQRKVGYKYHTSRNEKIKQLAENLQVDISNYGSLEDLQGKIFNLLTVISYNKESSKSHGRPYWNCKCECGNSTIVSAVCLKNGNTKSCGCLNRKNLNKTENAYFLPLYPTEKRKKGKVIWKCVCKKCNEIVELSTEQIQTQKSCGCAKTKDLKGQKFGKLLALRPTDNKKNRQIVWECKCECGAMCYVPSGSLQTGNTKSCGCALSKVSVGDVYGKLTVLNRNTDKIGYWNCQCECGKKLRVKGSYLINGTKKSCGCMISSGNYEVQKLLDSLDQNYEKEYSFKNLRDKGSLRFDFAVFSNEKLEYLIEYNGRQHYEPVPFFGGEKTFSDQERRDSLKIKYCKENHIPLVIFKYNEKVTKDNLLLKIREAKKNV